MQIKKKMINTLITSKLQQNSLAIALLFSRSVVSDSATPRTVACQAPLSRGFSRQEYWSELPFPPPGDLLNPGLDYTSLVSPAVAGEFFYPLSHGEASPSPPHTSF